MVSEKNNGIESVDNTKVCFRSAPPPPAFYTMMGEVVTLCWYGEMRVLVSVWIGLVLRGCLMSLYVLFAVSSSA